MASEKGLTVLARAKRWAKQLKGGESTYISKKRKNEMDVARLIKDYNARQAKKKPSKPKEEPKPEAKPKVKYAITAKERLEQVGITEQDLTKSRKK